MANPVVIKILAQAATAALTDEGIRKGVIIAGMIPFIVILIILSSPYAIFFAVTGNDEEPDSISAAARLAALKSELIQQIEFEQADSKVDEVQVVYMGSEDNLMIDNATDVLLTFAVRYNADDKSSEQLALLNDRQMENLSAMFWEMNAVQIKLDTRKEEVTYITTDEQGSMIQGTKTATYTIKTICVEAATAEEMAIEYHFTDRQIQILQALKKSSTQIYANEQISPKNALTADEIQTIRDMMPDGLEVNRKLIVDTALSLVGKVHYFWGGKSDEIGWDPRWGEMVEVTAAGSATSGTLQPFGLDCSGFATWTMHNAGFPVASIGQGTSNLWAHSMTVTEQQILPGDFTFLAVPGTRKVNHVGIIIGRGKDGRLLAVHCTSSADTVVVTTVEEAGFLYYRRPIVLQE